MTDKHPDDSSSNDSEKIQSGTRGKSTRKKKEWFHDSSLTELEALMAMIGMQRKKKSKEIDDPNESKNHKKKD